MLVNPPWAIQVFVMNIHNPFMHCVMSQYVFKLHDVIMLLHAVTMVTTQQQHHPPHRHQVMLFKWHVSPRFIIAIKQTANLKNVSHKVYHINQTKAISIPFMHNLCVIKARMHGCVQNYSKTHSTGVTGLHSRVRRSCNQVTQSRAFHCHFAHTHAFSL